MRIFLSISIALLTSINAFAGVQETTEYKRAQQVLQAAATQMAVDCGSSTVVAKLILSRGLKADQIRVGGNNARKAVSGLGYACRQNAKNKVAIKKIKQLEVKVEKNVPITKYQSRVLYTPNGSAMSILVDPKHDIGQPGQLKKSIQDLF